MEEIGRLLLTPLRLTLGNTLVSIPPGEGAPPLPFAPETRRMTVVITTTTNTTIRTTLTSLPPHNERLKPEKHPTINLTKGYKKRKRIL